MSGLLLTPVENERMSMWIMCSRVFFCVIAMMAFSYPASSQTLRERLETDQLLPVENSDGFNVLFMGTSSMVLDDGITQILIDGFITRTKHRYLGRIAPNVDQIRTAYEDFPICKAPSRQRDNDNPDECRKPKGRGLELIIPVHGHYDHALDAPYIAAWSGAELVCDQSVDAIVQASKRFPPIMEKALNWEHVCPTDRMPTRGKQIRIFNPGKFRITLFPSPHNRNLTTPFVSGVTAPFKFPAPLWKMKEGTAYSVLIEHRKRKLFIVPSAGDIGAIVRSNDIKADVVMLGTGGLRSKLGGSISRYWRGTVVATDAKRIIPIHWDNDQKPYDPELGNFHPSRIALSSRVLRTFDRLQKPDGPDLKFAPPLKWFDPFQRLK